MRYVRALLIVILFNWVSPVHSADRVFSVPLDALKSWSEAITVTMQNVTILGHSNVHAVASDCEMHFGAKVDGYNGDPSGWVMGQ